MGQGLVAAPLLRIIEEDLLPGPIVIAGLLTSGVLMARNSKRSDVPEVVPAIVGRAFGAVVAAALLSLLSERGLTITIGLIVLVVVCLRLGGFRIQKTPRVLLGTGIASGISGTIAGLGGAPMGLLYEQHNRARDFRGPMGVFLAVGGVISVTALTVFGQIDARGWLLGLALIPPLVVGWVLARWVTPVVDQGLLGPAVLVISSASALVLLVTQVV